MDWAKGYLLITLAAFLCEYIRLRVDYHILEIAIMVAAAPLAIFAICVLFYFALADLGGRAEVMSGPFGTEWEFVVPRPSFDRA